MCVIFSHFFSLSPLFFDTKKTHAMTHKFDGILFSRGKKFSFKLPTTISMKKAVQEAITSPFFQVCHTHCHTIGHIFHSSCCQIFSDRFSHFPVVYNKYACLPPVHFFHLFPLWGTLKKKKFLRIIMKEMAYYLTSHLFTLQNVAL